MGLGEHARLEDYVHCLGGRLNPALYQGRPKLSFLLQVRAAAGAAACDATTDL